MQTFTVVGFPIKHSLSPNLYNVGFKTINFSAKYTISEVPPAKFSKFIQDSFTLLNSTKKKSTFTGASITSPYKELILPFCHKLSTESKIINAVNCITVNNGLITGHNTDYYGFIQTIENIPNIHNKTILILGAGGAAKSCLYGLKLLNHQNIIISNRTMDKLFNLEKIFKFTKVNITELPACDILINCTSIGLNKSDPTIVSSEYLTAHKPIVFDLIYKPTQLKAVAEKLKLTVLDPKKMLYWQAVKQFELFTSHQAPLNEMWQSIN